ncbi:hypothetical protein SLW70_13690 [Flavobacterium sp. NG2]|uniref:hypothetical protein n=1 Tax=Flavobacterium sp. NG2 TaxID=3097547 RepID=UPI002A816D54|nr:hypothetical protein [Flavobacterium sp. NG2]WPR70975.1 hypothetical protein SLW70_13690 [Flavobacterium sp. NG2]
MMKNVSIAIASLALFSVLSCKEKKEESTSDSPQVIEKTNTVIIEKEAQEVKEENPDGTSISVDKDGLEFSTKDGSTKTEVNINK